MIRAFVAVLLPILLSGCVFSADTSRLIGQPAPVANLYLMNGAIESTASYHGKVLVLAFWDASCRYCRAEMPKLGHLASSFADREDVEFVAININDNKEAPSVEQAIVEYDLGSLKQAFSGNGVHDEAFISYHGTMVPFFVLIGKDGAIRWAGHKANSLRDPLIEELNPVTEPHGS